MSKSLYKVQTSNHRYNEVRSGPLPVVVGAPQGSILGPLFWPPYANDLRPEGVSTLKYADGTTLYSPVYRATANNILDKSLKKAAKWSDRSCMLLNATKTQIMTISLQNDSCINEEDTQQDQLNITDNAKLLGVTIDSSLNFKVHVENIRKKCNSRTFGIRKLKKFGANKESIVYCFNPAYQLTFTRLKLTLKANL